MTNHFPGPTPMSLTGKSASPPTHSNVTSYSKTLCVQVLYLILDWKLFLKYKLHQILLKFKSNFPVCIMLSSELRLHKN
jgi:hypothetical protein